jgi:hypothetical protein
MMNRFGLNDADMVQLLEADIDELRGEGESDLADRIRTEPAVRRAAEHIVARLAQVDGLIAAESASLQSAAIRTRKHAAGWKSAIVLTGTLAAAALAGVVLYRGAPENIPTIPARPLTATLNASSTRPFAVIPTDNPDIAVVWLFNKETK